ncbi:MAG: hypothetical protein EAY81_04425 [Bacteroidetes bacterium]|nr:MAG: hypothetical protein EAY81_04425 [Bacteroidota bacterium]
MQRTLFFIIAAILMGKYSSAQAQQIEIGKATDETLIITADTGVLKKAIHNMLHDGTSIQELSIQSFAQFHYLVATGTNQQFKKIVAIQLTYDIQTRLFYAPKQGSYVTCTSAACNNCSLFKESGKIIGCKCAEKSTISNQCNYTNIAQGTFYQHYMRTKQMNTKPALKLR